jgi:hypothetical protein
LRPRAHGAQTRTDWRDPEQSGFAAHRRMWQCSINTFHCIGGIFSDHMMVTIRLDCAMQTAIPHQGFDRAPRTTKPGAANAEEGERS